MYHAATIVGSTTAMLAQNNRGRGNYGRGNTSRGREYSGRGFQGRTNNNYRSSVRGSSHSYNSHGSQASIVCQICNKAGHSALTCIQYRPNNTPPIDDLPSAFSAMSMSGVPYAPTWFPDTGANNHMTADDSSFANRQAYNGTDQVTVANGTTLPISGIGNMNISTPSSTFKLRNVLPNLKANLLSVSRFTQDNDCLFEFNSSGFSIKGSTNGEAPPSRT